MEHQHVMGSEPREQAGRGGGRRTPVAGEAVSSAPAHLLRTVLEPQGAVWVGQGHQRMSPHHMLRPPDSSPGVLCGWGGQGPRIPASFMGQSSRRILGGSGLRLQQEEVGNQVVAPPRPWKRDSGCPVLHCAPLPLHRRGGGRGAHRTLSPRPSCTGAPGGPRRATKYCLILLLQLPAVPLGWEGLLQSQGGVHGDGHEAVAL